MKYQKFLVVFLVLVFVVSLPMVSRAQDTTDNTDEEGSITLINPLCDESSDPDNNCLLSVLGTIIARLLQLAAPAVAIMALIGGFQMLFAGGSPQKFTEGRKTITYAVIGFIVIIMAQGVVGIIQSIFGS